MKFKLLILFYMTLFNFMQKTNAQIPNKAEDISPLLVGETLPSAILKDANGNTTQLNKILNQKPSVLVFYRGGWCPYCNVQLSGLSKIEKDIMNLGFQIIAISPEDFHNLNTNETNTTFEYQLFADPDGQLIQDIGIAFSTPILVKGFIATKNRKGKTSEILPVPTVMILDKKGEILFEYINPNYKNRISEKMLLAVLKTIELND